MRLIVAAGAVSAVASLAWAQAQVTSPQDFAATAASSDLFEIRSSEAALQKAQNAAVKEFAQMMIKDHTAASKELMAAAKKDGVAVPDQMADKHAAQLRTLNETTSASFDKAYVTAQLAAHQEALALMQSFAAAGGSAALKAHAQKTAPVIQMHLEHVQKLDQQK
ncbi:MAG: DUF4142 domain-containing protein [Chelatococcus sp.]|nr:DUF4142 domain-containing protein [Chelatococcus sp. YT9]MBX3556763.1 DUF4142 domain-containing protein [Chelatococcus sp.]